MLPRSPCYHVKAIISKLNCVLVVQVIVLWTANTERFSDVRPGLNDTAANLLASIRRNEAEVSPSTLFAVASILEGVTYINGSPQNTFVPGCIELAQMKKVGRQLKSTPFGIWGMALGIWVSGLDGISVDKKKHSGREVEVGKTSEEQSIAFSEPYYVLNIIQYVSAK